MYTPCALMTPFRPRLKTASEMLLKLTINIVSRTVVSFRRESTRFTSTVVYSYTLFGLRSVMILSQTRYSTKTSYDRD